MSPKSWAIFGIVVGFIVAIILGCVGFFKLSNNIPYHILMRRDAREYQEIIDKANRGEAGYYTVYIDGLKCSGSSTMGGNPTEYRLSNDSDRGWRYEASIKAYCEVTKGGINYYWLDITFYSEELDERISGITYSYYAEAQVVGMSSLSLVYTKAYDGDGSYDIIQSNYSLDKNIDYWYAGNQILWGVILIVMTLGLGGLMVWCCILVHNHGKKKSPEVDMKKAQEIADKFKECQYCGAQTRLDDTHCTVCGARKFNKIKKTDK